MSMLTVQCGRLRIWERYLRDQEGQWVELHSGNVRMIANELRDAADTIEWLRGKLQGNDTGEVDA